MIDLSKHLIKATVNIKEALKNLDEVSEVSLTLFVVDQEAKMLGTLTDGDIRRGFLRGLDLTDTVEKFMNSYFYYLNEVL